MSKKLTARVQKLNPSLKDQSKRFSTCIVIEPDSKEVALSKGNVYAVFAISSDSALDTNLTTKILSDVLHDIYYTSDNVSPIQSLEKAVSVIQDKVTTVSDSSTIVDNNIEFNALVSVLWGNVFYVVQYGTGAGYLMRGNEIKPIQTVGEGKFLSTSGVVKDDDLIILCTDSFVKKFPPKRLLTMAMTDKDLGEADSCMLLKLVVDTTFTEADLSDLNPIPASGKQKVEIIVDSIINKMHTIGIDKKINDLLVAKPVSKKKGLKINFKLLGLLLGSLLLLGGIGYGSYRFLNTKKNAVEIKKETKEVEVGSSEPTAVVEDDYSKDADLKIERVQVAQTLYDLIIADEAVKPTELDIYNDKLIVVDSDRGKVYTSILGDYRFLPIQETYLGIKNITMTDTGEMVFSDKEGIKFYDIVNLELKSSFATTAPGDIGVFGDYIYTFNNDELIKYTKEAGILVSSVWGQNSDFSNAKIVQIAYSIYAVTADNTIVKYTTGQKDIFEVSALETPFSNIVSMVVKEDFKNIYIADKGNNRVVVLNSNGKFVKQYKYNQSAEWSDLKSIAVDDKEETLYVLSGTKIYEIKL